MGAELVELLENWGRWARGGIKQETCGSAEKNYRAPWRQWLQLHEIPMGGNLDTFAAEAVERAWKTLHHKQQKILKLHYVRRLPVTLLCQRAKIKPWQYEAHMARAHYYIRMALDSHPIA